MFSLKRANKNLQKRARRASEIFYDFVGLSPRKELLRALLAGDEEKAIQVYVLVTNGKSLEEDLYPSLPLVESTLQTPMHLAALKGMEYLLQMFFKRGGNPNILNANNETCLHAVCREPGQDDKKRNLLLAVLEWKEQRYTPTDEGGGHLLNEKGGEEEAEGGGEDIVTCSISEDMEVERVSVNMVDNDGNTACHYAASSGLARCVLELVRRGAIISIVNKDQMTCCELADAGLHVQLANSLELALVFQPTDRSTLFLSEGGDFQHEADQPLFLPDASSFTSASLWDWRQLQVAMAQEALVTHSVPQIEALLDSFDWNIHELVYRYMSDTTATLAAANLNEMEKEKGTPPPPPQGVAENLKSEKQEETGDTKREEAVCSICAETMYPPVSPKQLMAMTNGLDKDGVDRDQRQIDCGGGHSFCFSCWSTNLRMRVVDNSCSALSCPAYQCGEALESEVWAECLLGADIAKRFHENVCRRLVDSSVDFCWCPAKDCDLVIHVDEEARSSSSSSSAAPPLSPQVTVTCGNGHSVCLACKDVGHAPCSCEDFALWKTKIAKEINDSASQDTNDIATALWVQANTKKCPKCKTPIEKDEGCNHMTCKKCRYDFCWICMQRWENHSNRTGGYFQCNMFAGGEDVGEEDAEVGGSSLFSDTYSGGSSTKETLRLRKNAAIMDRFIQHYTSYKAHEDSVQLEVRMQFDTLERITRALQRSVGAGAGADCSPGSNADAELCWLRGEEVPHPFLQTAANSCGSTSGLEKKQEAAGMGDGSISISAQPPANQKGVCHDGHYCRRGDVESLVDSSFYPILFLQKGFRELIKCRQLLKAFFPFSFYVLSEDHSRPGARGSQQHPVAHRMLVESRQDAIDRVRADLETLTETLSNIVARKRLRASRSEIERATRAARSTRLEFEYILSEFLKACESNALSSGGKANSPANNNRQKSKSKSRWEHITRGSQQRRPDHGIYGSRRGVREADAMDSLSLSELSIFENIQFLQALAGRDRSGHMFGEPRGRGHTGGGRGRDRSRDDRGGHKSSGSQRRTSSHRALRNGHGQRDRSSVSDEENVLDMDSIDFSDNYNPSKRAPYHDEVAALSAGGGEGGSRSRSSSVSSSSSTSSVNIRQVGNDGVSFTVQTKSPPPKESGRDKDGSSDEQEASHNSLNHVAIDSKRERERDYAYEYEYEYGGGAEEEDEDDEGVEMNRAILLSLQQLPPPPNGSRGHSGGMLEPSEAEIQALLVMGFERDMAHQALRDCSNNVEDAIMLLLSKA